MKTQLVGHIELELSAWSPQAAQHSGCLERTCLVTRPSTHEAFTTTSPRTGELSFHQQLSSGSPLHSLTFCVLYQLPESLQAKSSCHFW